MHGAPSQNLNGQERGIRVTNDRKILVAWAAGFFEGEGHVNLQLRKNKSFLAISLAQVHREPLDQFVGIFGGKVYGPYGPYSTNKQPYYQATLYSEDALGALNEMLPYLFRKGEQAKEKIEQWRDYASKR